MTTTRTLENGTPILTQTNVRGEQDTSKLGASTPRASTPTKHILEGMAQDEKDRSDLGLPDLFNEDEGRASLQDERPLATDPRNALKPGSVRVRPRDFDAESSISDEDEVQRPLLPEERSLEKAKATFATQTADLYRDAKGAGLKAQSRMAAGCLLGSFALSIAGLSGIGIGPAIGAVFGLTAGLALFTTLFVKKASARFFGQDEATKAKRSGEIAAYRESYEDMANRIQADPSLLQDAKLAEAWDHAQKLNKYVDTYKSENKWWTMLGKGMLNFTTDAYLHQPLKLVSGITKPLFGLDPKAEVDKFMANKALSLAQRKQQPVTKELADDEDELPDDDSDDERVQNERRDATTSTTTLDEKAAASSAPALVQTQQTQGQDEFAAAVKKQAHVSQFPPKADSSTASTVSGAEGERDAPQDKRVPAPLFQKVAADEEK